MMPSTVRLPNFPAGACSFGGAPEAAFFSAGAVSLGVSFGGSFGFSVAAAPKSAFRFSRRISDRGQGGQFTDDGHTKISFAVSLGRILLLFGYSRHLQEIALIQAGLILGQLLLQTADVVFFLTDIGKFNKEETGGITVKTKSTAKMPRFTTVIFAISCFSREVTRRFGV